MNDDELTELLRVVDEPAPVPADIEARVWSQLAELIQSDATDVAALESSPSAPAPPGPPSAPPAGSAPATDPTPASVRGHDARSNLVLLAAAALAVIVGAGFLIALVIDNDADDPVTTDDVEVPDGSSTTASSAAPTSADPPSTRTGPPEFDGEIEVGLIGNTFAAIRFTSTTDTEFVAEVRSGTLVADSVSGIAVGDNVEVAAFEDLEPGTEYEVTVTLFGPPEVRSDAIIIRTAGTAAAPTPAEQVEVLDLRVVRVEATEFQVDYDTNVCANGTFVVVDENGTEVGRNDGQPEGCTTQHLAVPGMWTPALEPGSRYRITVTVEANGAGLGDGNTASSSLEVTTLPE